MDTTTSSQSLQQGLAALLADKQYQAACTILQTQLAHTPEDGRLCEQLAEIYFLQHLYADAAKYFQLAAQYMPDSANPPFQLGNIYARLGRFEEACQFYVKALRISPNAVQAYEALAKALIRLQAYDEAVKAYHRALKITPNAPSVHLGLATALLENNAVEQSLAHYRLALQHKPHPIEHSSFLFALNYRPEIPPGQVRECHLDWGRLHTAHLATFEHLKRKPLHKRKVRIGLVSSDFYRHPVTYYLEPYLEHYDKNRFEIYCYSNEVKHDEVTDRLKGCVDGWRTITTADISSAVAKIREDEIDILVDLSGQTACKLLLIFGHKPAPIQISWLGYFNTTGVESMDYLITDPYSSPHDQSAYFTEQLLYLPHNRFCYRPPEYAPEVAPLPALESGYVTFGCFNNYLKLNRQVIAVWAKVLHACPESKLLLKNKAMNDALMRKQLLANFEQHGIGAERLLLEKTSPHAELLSAYNRVDIALDPFPFTGGLTTSEALWMGVPVVTLAGETLVSRQGAAFLTVLDKQEWIASNEETYVNIAASLAADNAKLANIRQQLRKQMRASPLCDGAVFTRNLEQLLLGVLQ